MTNMISYQGLVRTFPKALVMMEGLDEEDTPQGEIVNILLKIKNSFLPTKQILIGL